MSIRDEFKHRNADERYLALFKIVETIVYAGETVRHNLDGAWLERAIRQSLSEDLHGLRREVVLCDVQRKLSRLLEVLQATRQFLEDGVKSQRNAHLSE